MYTLEQLEQKTLKELKEIGWQLSVLPAGDRRCRQNWIDALVGAKLPLLELLEVSPGAEVESVAEAIEVQRQEPIEVQATEPIEVQRQEPIELAAKNSPGVKVDRPLEPIEVQSTEAHEPTSATSLSKVPALGFKAILRADFSHFHEMSCEQLLVFSQKAISEPISFQKEHRELLLEVLDWASLVALRYYLNSTLLYLPDIDSFASAPVNLGIEVNCRWDWLKGRMEYEATQFFPEGNFKTYCDDFSYLLRFVYEHFGFGAVHPGGNITALSYLIGFIRYVRTQADRDDPPFDPLQISCPYRVKPIEKFQAQESAEVQAPDAIFNDEQPPNRGDGKGRLETEPKVSQSAIAPATENSPGVSRKTSTAHQLLELFKSSAHIIQDSPAGEIEPELSHSAIAPATKNLLDVQADLNPISTGITFSDRFLARYSPPPSEKIHYQADTNGQLSLLDFEIELTDEPPDPDDFESLDAFREAMAVWDSEHCEPCSEHCGFSSVHNEPLSVLLTSLDSMCQWAPCPDDWYEPSSVSELSPAIESSSTCNFFIPTFDAWCDRANRQNDTDEPPDTGIFARLPKPKPPSFPPRAIDQTQVSPSQPKSTTWTQLGHNLNASWTHTHCIAAGSSSQSGRSPPGGDVM